MKKALQVIAVLLAGATVGTWLATGAHRGWTKTQVEKITVDEITGIEGRSYERKFVAGVEVLGAGLMVAGGFAGISLFFRNQPKPN